MSQFERLHRNKNLIEARRVVSFNDLMRELEVSRATLKRDLVKLRDIQLPVAASGPRSSNQCIHYIAQRGVFPSRLGGQQRQAAIGPPALLTGSVLPAAESERGPRRRCRAFQADDRGETGVGRSRNSPIQQLNKAVQQNAGVTEEVASTAEELASQSEQLRNAIAFFKVAEQGAAQAAAPALPAPHGQSMP